MRINKTRWRSVWRKRRADAATLSAIIPIFTLLFATPILSGKSFALYDAFAESYPLRTVAWNELRHGRLPLWTPAILSGYPMLSMAQLALAYPITWGYIFLPGYVAEEICVLLPYLLTPVFVYCFAREINRSRPASLLAGLAYGYGGFGITGFPHNGFFTNTMMWLPLLLIAIERARKKSFSRCLTAATLAYSMSVLTGMGQGFLYIGILAALYGCFLGFAATRFNAEDDASVRDDNLFAWQRWRPFAVAVCAILLSAGVAAFQIFETMPAATLSIRSELSYQTFIYNSLTWPRALRDLFAPVGLTVYYLDASAHITPFALTLAICAAFFAVRKNPRERRVFFWLAVAVLGWTLMLGSNTPLYPLLYHVPLLNRFRLSPRHAFEWTFSIAILSAYGWDALDQFFTGARENQRQRRALAICLCLLAAALIVGARWFTTAGSLIAPSFSDASYLCLKALFVLLLIGASWQAWQLASNSRWRTPLLTCIIALACFLEPFIIVTGWWWTIAKPIHRFTEPSPVTRFLAQFTPEQNRIYTRTELFVDEYEDAPAIDPANLTALYGLQNVAGYEPLILKRYSQALGNTGMDATTPVDGSPPDNSLLGSRSHVLDLLNDSFLVAYRKPPVPDGLIFKGNVGFPLADNTVEIKPGATVKLFGIAAEGDTLGVVSALAFSSDVTDNTPVAKLRIIKTNGDMLERELRAGTDTAEWAHERPDVRPTIRHSLAPIFDAKPGDEANTFSSYRYLTSFALGAQTYVDRVEVTNLTANVAVTLWKTTLYDSLRQTSMPFENLTSAEQDFDRERWQTVYDQNRARIFHNTRALPRVWLTKEAKIVDAGEALRRIRGESPELFDPTRTALLEIPQGAKVELPGGEANANDTKASARLLLYEPNRILIETSAKESAVLVASEINYPGWAATIDGKGAQIFAADFLLRGVILPPGSHRIEMRYAAPAAQKGAVMSLLSLIVLCGVTIYGWRETRKARLRVPDEKGKTIH